MPNIARAQVLKEGMYTQVPFILSSSIACASSHIEAIQAHPGQLLLQDPTDINTLFARAMHDVCQAGGARHGRVLEGFPL